MKNNNFIPITSDAVKISNNIYAIYSSKDFLLLPIKRTVEEIENNFTFEYLISQINNVENMNINSNGEILNFTRNLTAKAFIVPLIHGEYYIFINSTLNFSYYSMNINKESIILE